MQTQTFQHVGQAPERPDRISTVRHQQRHDAGMVGHGCGRECGVVLRAGHINGGRGVAFVKEVRAEVLKMCQQREFELYSS